MVTNRFKEARKAARMTQQEVAQILDVSLDTIWRLESGQRKPKAEEVQKLADLYGVTYSYLLPSSPGFAAMLTECIGNSPMRLEELAERANVFSSDLARYASGEIEPSGGKMRVILEAMKSMGWKPKMAGDAQKEDGGAPVFDVPSSRGETLRIPILSREKSACCGQGFPNSSEIYADMYDYLDMPAALVGVVSTEPELRPYFMYADGDSMIKAGIMDGFLVLVNPAEPVYDGDSALVEYGIDGNIAIKRVYWLAEGAVKIASADDSGWSRTFSREEIQEQGLFRVKGKIMFAGIRPKRG